MPSNTPPEEVDHAVNLLMALNDTLQTYIDTHGPLNHDVMISCGELCALAVAQVGFDANATPEQFAITLDGVLERVAGKMM